MHFFRFFKRYKHLYADEIVKPDLVFALCKSKFRPGCIVGEADPATKKVPVYFYHNEEEVDVPIDSVIYHHSNLMMVKVSFCRKGKVYCGTVYGNDSPKYEGEPRTFYIRLSKREMVSVPLRYIFLTKLQAKRLLHVRVLDTSHNKKSR